MVDLSEHFVQAGGEQAPAHQGSRDAAGAPLSQQHPEQDWITRARASLIGQRVFLAQISLCAGIGAV